MRLERHEEQEYPAVPLSPLLNREAREAANSWLARFAPLLNDLEALTAGECRRRLEQVPELREEGERALARLEQQATRDDLTLLSTLRGALRELDGLESDFRRRLGLLAPGDPAGQVDLEQIRAKIAEVEARREVGAFRPSHLEMRTAPGSPGAALFMGIFSLGWLSFTTFHSFLMIGGMMHAFGWGALALLPFYGIFWAVGLGMAWAAFRAGSSEQIRMAGLEMTVRRRFGPCSWERKFPLSPESRVYLATAAVRGQGMPLKEVAVRDREGREIRIASGLSRHEQQRLVERLNAYLSALPGGE